MRDIPPLHAEFRTRFQACDIVKKGRYVKDIDQLSKMKLNGKADIKGAMALFLDKAIDPWRIHRSYGVMCDS